MRQGWRGGLKEACKTNFLKEGETLKTKKHYCESLLALVIKIYGGFFVSGFLPSPLDAKKSSNYFLSY